MEKVKFNVSTKTARLIGRENISDSNGAIIELVKNAYDADADSVYIKFDIIYENVPDKIVISENQKYFNSGEYEKLTSFYTQNGDVLSKKSNLTDKQEQQLKNLLFSKNSIVIFDNGTGMSEQIVKTVWMNIGTNDKEINAYSKKGRIKTGAKGIGRFALEKLSQKTTVYSKKMNDKLVYWDLDWMQFERKSLLNEINADVEILDSNFNDIISKYIDFSMFDMNDKIIDSGTLIILSGTRENWNDRIYNRINNNLSSINPFGNVDTFNVFINNVRTPKFNYHPQNTLLSSEDYDYIIKASYDGENNVGIDLVRNEVDLSATTEESIIGKKIYNFDINEFWNREAFKQSNYKKEKYASTFHSDYKATELLSKTPIEEIKKIGKFDLQFYFLKSGKSEYKVIKDIKTNRRKKLLSTFSGIKIYRDNFKVRPYGEDGPMYDWLQLGARVQSSPAAVSHPSGYWRVNTYQLIGNVNIGRINNPNLTDMANREGLTLNDTYYLFVELIKSIISKFEYDRQYFYREYVAWLKRKAMKINPTEAIQNSIIQEKEKKQESSQVFSTEEYRDAIYQTIEEKKSSEYAMKILMTFSSVGVTANTFAHEMKSLSTNLATRNQQLKICVNNILGHKEYTGLDFLNPYDVIEDAERCDILLSKWLKLIMDSANKANSKVEKILLSDFFYELKDDWYGLLHKKNIDISVIGDNNCYVNCEKNDLYLIFNNLLLNSAYFLEQEINGEERLIIISYKKNKDYILINFQNNGPKLAEKFLNNPDIIFEAGETAKKDGTGLGLWICKEAVHRNNGEIHVVNNEVGFEIGIKWPGVD